MEFKITGVSSEVEKQILAEKFLEDFNWGNFSKGDVVWVESLTPSNLPNLVYEDQVGNVVYLRKK